MSISVSPSTRRWWIAQPAATHLTLMTQRRKLRGVKTTPDGVSLLQKAKALGRVDEGRPFTFEGIAEKAKVSKKTVERFFHRESVDLDSAISIIEALELQQKDVLSTEDFLV
ncbi:MAG: hypothetical protein F6K28_50885 [Microcoleus sp. SIO2G3]|nr:hypothetical protein [Microcoleus sp. SIO2G3]